MCTSHERSDIRCRKPSHTKKEPSGCSPLNLVRDPAVSIGCPSGSVDAQHTTIANQGSGPPREARVLLRIDLAVDLVVRSPRLTASGALDSVSVIFDGANWQVIGPA